MILAGRQSHRRMWLMLAVLLPTIIAAAWWSRRPSPVNDRLPAILLDSPAP